MLVVQCDCGNFYEELINCARFTIIDEHTKYVNEKSNKEYADLDPYETFNEQEYPDCEIVGKAQVVFHVVLVVQIPKIAGGCFTGFQTASWFCYHIDDLQDAFALGNMLNYQNKSLSEVFAEALTDDNNNKRIGGDVSASKTSYFSLMAILKSIIFVACSKIGSASVLAPTAQLGSTNRSIVRVEILLNLLSSGKNSAASSRVGAAFTHALLGNVHRLQGMIFGFWANKLWLKYLALINRCTVRKLSQNKDS